VLLVSQLASHPTFEISSIYQHTSFNPSRRSRRSLGLRTVIDMLYTPCVRLDIPFLRSFVIRLSNPNVFQMSLGRRKWRFSLRSFAISSEPSHSWPQLLVALHWHWNGWPWMTLNGHFALTPLTPCLMYFWLPQLWGKVIRLHYGLLTHTCGVLSMWAYVLWAFVPWAFVRVGFSPTFKYRYTKVDVGWDETHLGAYSAPLASPAG